MSPGFQHGEHLVERVHFGQFPLPPGPAQSQCGLVRCARALEYLGAGRLEPLAVDVSGPEATVTARVTGDFPGSPVKLQYRFTLEGALIARLEITS